MSQLKDSEQVEVIERYVAGGLTEYSVDGGKVWWTKEQFQAVKAHTHKLIGELLSEFPEKMEDPFGDHYNIGFNQALSEVTAILEKKKQ